MASLRDHREVKAEVEWLAEKQGRFLAFHRKQIQGFVTSVVQDGDRSRIKEQLRGRANDVVTPLMEIVDELRAKNIEFGSSNLPLWHYRLLVQKLDRLNGKLSLLMNLKPKF